MALLLGRLGLGRLRFFLGLRLAGLLLDLARRVFYVVLDARRPFLNSTTP